VRPDAGTWPDLTTGARQALLALARASVHSVVGVREGTEIVHHPVFEACAGAFVTLHVSGALRGCIGIAEAGGRLGRVVAHCAAAAAREDPRFRPLRADDLEALAIEISVLSAAMPLSRPDDVVVGRHGVMVDYRGRRGLLLPQVAASRGWEPATFLDQVCLKAELPANAWQNGAVIHFFEADVFGDVDPAGTATAP
jgi:hypothetical protein